MNTSIATTSTTLVNKRRLALLIGWSLILMAVAGGYSLGYALPALFSPNNLDQIKDDVLNNWGTYQLMVVGLGITIILDLVVSYGIFAYFKGDHPKMALVSGVLRLVYTLILGIAAFFLIQNMWIADLSNLSIYTNFSLFETIWYSGLLIFGLHIVATGFLMKWHRKIPGVLYYLTMVAGVAYFIIHAFKLLNIDGGFMETLEMALALPMILGELGLAIWLLIKGGKS